MKLIYSYIFYTYTVAEYMHESIVFYTACTMSL